MANYTWDSKDTTVVVSGFIIKGFPTDGKVKITRNEDGYTLAIGVDGDDSTRSRSNNSSGEITIMQNYTSTSVPILDGLLQSDENDNSGTFAVSVTNTALGMECSGNDCYIKKRPDYDIQSEMQSLEYVIVVPFMVGPKRV
jgi:hypothetical protein